MQVVENFILVCRGQLNLDPIVQIAVTPEPGELDGLSADEIIERVVEASRPYQERYIGMYERREREVCIENAVSYLNDCIDRLRNLGIPVPPGMALSTDEVRQLALAAPKEEGK